MFLFVLCFNSNLLTVYYFSTVPFLRNLMLTIPFQDDSEDEEEGATSRSTGSKKKTPTKGKYSAFS